MQTFQLPMLSPSYRYDQTEVVARIIVGFAKARDATSLLDIGAGNGAVARQIAISVKRYLAVEEDQARAQNLRRAGLDVIHARFPVEIDQRFDMVVSSHSIPEFDFSYYGPFLGAAWKLLVPGGLLLIITFKGDIGSPVIQLAEELAGRNYQPDRRYPFMIELLKTYGEVIVSRVDSHVESEEFSDIAKFFGHWLWNNAEQEAQITPRLRTALDSRFRHDGRYRVATPHTVVTVFKPA
jgi:cyclopropane fatty-acyl-phospholipid synthase-like methyltransferase